MVAGAQRGDAIESEIRAGIADCIGDVDFVEM
jgi:hypothetical protein